MLVWSFALIAAQGWPPQEKPAPTRDYAIYRVVLESHLHEGANLDNSLLLNRTVTRDATFRRSVLRVTPKERPDSVLLDSLAMGVEAFTPHVLEAAGFGRAVRFISESEFRAPFRGNSEAGWSTLRTQFPGLRSVIQLSNVAYTATGDYAVVYVAVRCGSLCGLGQFYYLALKDGNWAIVRVELEWVS
jgi:hypothetical protein